MRFVPKVAGSDRSFHDSAQQARPHLRRAQHHVVDQLVQRRPTKRAYITQRFAGEAVSYGKVAEEGARQDALSCLLLAPCGALPAGGPWQENLSSKFPAAEPDTTPADHMLSALSHLSARHGQLPPSRWVPGQDFGNFDSKFAGARSAQKFPQRLRSEAKFAVTSTISSSHHGRMRLAHCLTHTLTRHSPNQRSRVHITQTSQHRQSSRVTIGQL